MQIIWADTTCSSIANTPTGHKLTAEWINDDKWLWFVQDDKGSVCSSFKLSNEQPQPSRQAAKTRAYNAFLQINH